MSGPGAQAGGDALEQKRAVFLLRTLAAEVAGRPDVATLLDLYESLGDFAVFSVEVRPSPTLLRNVKFRTLPEQ